MSDMPAKESGHRLHSFNTIVPGNGQHTIIVFDLIDRDTKEQKEQFRCFTNYQGLSLLISKFLEAACISVEKLVASGASKEFVQPLRDVSVLHHISSSVGLSTDKTSVSIEIQTAEGPLLAFALDPQSAQRIGQSLMATAKQTKQKGSLN